MVRIVICVDLPHDDPVEAYRALYRLMKLLPDQHTLPHADADCIDGWESTNEWFGSDGEQMTESEVDAARTKGLELEQDAEDGS